MNKKSSRISLFVLFTLIFFGSLWRYTPNIIFYFDQIEGVAEVLKISRKNVSIKYLHEPKKETVYLSLREGNSKKLRNLKVGSKVAILYSKNFPARMTILNYDKNPDLSEIFIILICAIPLIFFKNIK